MAKTTVPQGRDAEQIKGLLRSPEVAALIADLEATRWTGRPGYPIRTMVGMTLVKSLYVLPTWTRTVRLVAEHAAIRKAIGGAPRLMPATASPPSCAATRAPLTLASQRHRLPARRASGFWDSTSQSTAPTSLPTPTDSDSCPRA